jgi:hypothetical protein
MKRILAAVFSLFALNLAFAQSEPTCGTVDYLEQIRLENPDEYQSIMQAQQDLEAFVANGGGQSNGRAVVTIPIVFHVIHDGEQIGTGSNISDAAIQSQVDILNEDFRKLNADIVDVVSQFQSIAADAEVEFCLATVDENGNPSSGINRYQYSGAPWGQSSFNTVKSQTYWDPDKYLNFWVCELNQGLLGYATPPGGFASRDGVVVGYQYVGRPPHNIHTNNYNNGRTATHEIGHWLGLRHIWGDGDCSQDDGVSDTPLQDGSNSGCNTTRNTCGSLDNTQNYMDYSFDRCLLMFTNGQKNVMQGVLNSSRSTLKSSDGCDNFTVVSHSGRVVDALTGLGVPNAKALFDGGNILYEVTTNSSGDFTITNFREGSYDVYGGKWGFMTNQKSINTFITSGSFSLIPIDFGTYYDDFLMDFGWNTFSTASTGDWVRDFPIGTNFNGADCNPGADVTNDFGDMAFVTGNGGGSAGDDDVDNGVVELITPDFNGTWFADPKISFYAWFYNGGGNGGAPDDDLIITLDNGITSTTLTTINSNITGSNNWNYYEFLVRDYMLPTTNMTVSFETSDLSTGHLVEAALDLFKVEDAFTNSIGLVREELGLSVFPNPSTGTFTMSMEKPYDKPLKVYVYDALGREVYQGEWPAGVQAQYQLNLEGNSPGLYIMKAEGEGVLETSRLMLR